MKSDLFRLLKYLHETTLLTGLFHENHVTTLPDFDSLNHAAYTAEMHWHTYLL